jgi:hypothetical protein
MKLKNFEPKAKYPIRSPDANVLRVDSDAAGRLYGLYEGPEDRLHELKDNAESLKYARESAVWNLPKVLEQMHGRGDPIEDIAQRLVEAVEYTESIQKYYPETGFIGNMATPEDCGRWAICLLLAPDENLLQRLRQLVRVDSSERLYSFDTLLGAFWPDWQLPKKYNRRSRGKHIMAWSDALTRAMASDDRETGLDRYMKNYERLAKPFRPYKWVPWEKFKIKYSSDGEKQYGNANYQFAFEAAFAVCAFDLNDEKFRDHRYYPRDLVDYYREHIRHTRDAWRNERAGSGVTIEMPPPTKKINLAKSKSKNLKRWLELISDGDADAAAAVVAAIGNIRKIKDPIALFEAMYDCGIGIYADVKEDELLASDLQSSMDSRDIKGYQTPDTKTDGNFARCEELLNNAIGFLHTTPYSLYVIDLQADSLRAVLVADEFQNEFLLFSNSAQLTFSSVSSS